MSLVTLSVAWYDVVYYRNWMSGRPGLNDILIITTVRFSYIAGRVTHSDIDN